MSCVSCGRGFHEECVTGCDQCHKDTELNVQQEIIESDAQNETAPKRKGKREHELRDPKSTGRKRAAKLYPILIGEPCEWRGKKNCGGGRRPIIGCVNGTQEARHHGPVKDTTRNEEGNVHRICTSCHNHWHELNDLVYDPADYNKLPHDPQPATDEELASFAILWISGEIGKKYELASTKNHEKGKLRLTD